MTTYNTGNPIGSTAVKDLYDNAENLDVAVNDTSRDTWSDRLGRSRKTMSGMERQFDAAEDYREATFVLTQADKQSRFDADQDDKDARFNTFIASSGYQFLGDYAAGIEITEYNQIVRDSNGEFWRLSGQVGLPYTTTGTGLPENDSLTPLGDAVLRQELADGTAVVSSTTGVQTVAEALNDRLSAINIENYGAVESGDNTTAITNAVSDAIISGSPIFWNYGKTYPASGNIPNLLRVKHEGSATITRGADSYHIGHSVTGVDNTIYVSASGSSSNDGIAATEPLDLTTGFNLLKQQAARNPQVKWTLKLAAGTYPDGPSRRFEDFPITSQSVDFIGEKDESDTPTTIFNAWSNSVFRKLSGSEGIQLFFKDLKFTNCTESALVLWHGCSIVTDNLHSDGHAAAPFSYRRSRVSHRGGRIENGNNGVILEDCYGVVGDNRPPTGAKKVVFNNITRDSGNSVCVDISRGSVAYVVNCDFGLTAACDIHISQSRIARCRTVSNNHGAYNTAILRQEGPLCVFNDDLSNIDDFSLSGATVGTTPIQSSPGSYFSRFANGLNLVGHLVFRGPRYTLTGTARTLASVDEQGLTPFRMPAVWLMSPTATGIVEYEIRGAATEEVLFEINGVAAGTGQRLAACSFNTRPGQPYVVRFEISGPLAGQTRGRYVATVTGDNSIQTAFGSTNGLSHSAFTSPSLEEQPYRLYITRGDGSGDFEIIRSASWVAM